MSEKNNNEKEIKISAPFEGIALLNYLQTNMKVPKDKENTFGKYKYRSIEDIDEKFKETAEGTGAAKTRTVDIVKIGDRYYAKVTSRLYDYKGNLVAETVGFAREAESKKGMDPSQITGAAISYAAKYAEAAMFCLEDTPDADAINTHEENNNYPEPKQIQKNQNITQILKNKKKKLSEYLKIKSIPAKTQPDFINFLKTKNYDVNNINQLNYLLQNKNVLDDFIDEYLEMKLTEAGI
jgi:hypothetical protein